MATLVPTIEIALLPGTERYGADIKLFVDAMVHKLYKHRRKGYWEDNEVPMTFAGLMGEIEELREALLTENLSWILEESADVANMALILASLFVRRVAKESEVKPTVRELEEILEGGDR